VCRNTLWHTMFAASGGAVSASGPEDELSGVLPGGRARVTLEITCTTRSVPVLTCVERFSTRPSSAVVRHPSRRHDVEQ